MPRAGDSDVRRWIERYFNDCVCSVRGELSFGLGMISFFCWGIAEVPQIITNFHNKSGHGVSLTFLLTWVVGKPHRGCQVEEDSCKALNPNSEDHGHPVPTLTASRRASPRTDVCYTYVRLLGFHCLPDEPKQVLVLSTCRFARVCRSARSLASSGTPPCRSSYLGPARSGPSASGYMESSGSDDERSPRHRTWRSGMSKPSRILSRSVSRP
ncbi:hypothetical protein GW17_00025361 [Ensete ventricosum]|nr:hypothetical protein GW17_00025361 [Ensete ventricosum]